MDKLINSLITIYKESNLYRSNKNLYQLALYLTNDGELHLINTGGFGVHCATNERYSNISSKQIKYSFHPLKNQWFISNQSCEHGFFSELNQEDIDQEWTDKILVKRPANPYFLKPA